MKLTLGFSPCPNDTFIFDALVHKKIDVEGLDFDVFFSDVERLNKWGCQGKLDVTKLSFGAFFKCLSKYILLDSGSALGRNCGPLLIKRPSTILNSDSKIAIPGEYTTANFLLGISDPQYLNKVEVVFSEIEDVILSGDVDAGLIIHESRFVYHQKGLEKVKDLGEFWEQLTGFPLPLGGIGIKRDLPLEIQKKMNRVLRRSVEYALENRHSSFKFIESHAQQMERDVIEAHIDLYVNNYSISLGAEGRSSVRLLFEKIGCDRGSIFL